LRPWPIPTPLFVSLPYEAFGNLKSREKIEFDKVRDN
jgi:hypothetical protein